MRPKIDVERRIGDVATRQHGVVARRQLLAEGLSAEAIKRRVRAGRLHVVHRGVYAVGHRVLGPQGRWPAAVLACGDDRHLERACRAAHLPPPLVNHPVGRMSVDFLWPDRRVIVETDGGPYHRTPTQRDRDRRRDALLTKWHYTVLRLPDTEINKDPTAIATALHAALGSRRTP